MAIKYSPIANAPQGYDPTSVLAQGAAVQSFAAIIGRSLDDYRKRKERSEAADILSGVNPQAGAFMDAGGDPEIVLGAQRLLAAQRGNELESQGLQQKQRAADAKASGLAAFGAKLPSFLQGDEVDVGGALQYGSALGLDPSDVTPQVTALATEAGRRRDDYRAQQTFAAQEEERRRKEQESAEEKSARDSYFSTIANLPKGSTGSIEGTMGDFVQRAYDESQLSPEQVALLNARRAEKVSLKFVNPDVRAKLTELATRGKVPESAQKTLEAQYFGEDVFSSRTTDKEALSTELMQHGEKVFGSKFDKGLPPVTEARQLGRIAKLENKGDTSAPPTQAIASEITSLGRSEGTKEASRQFPESLLGQRLAAANIRIDKDPIGYEIERAKLDQERENVRVETIADKFRSLGWGAYADHVEAQAQQDKFQRVIELARKAIKDGREREYVSGIFAAFDVDPNMKLGGKQSAPSKPADRLGTFPGVGGKDD